ncbi:hypothetical protein COY95_02155, partial [Candidatus Woesearchaeota archaeon CG_4_10_14_0_8_um_filter_47_5]
FYRNLAHRNLFEKKFKNPESMKKGFFGKLWGGLMFLVRYLVIFPVISFLWFLILAGFLLFLSKSHDVSQIFLMSMTIIAASRITAYYNEDLSKDVAKLIPFALLGVFIVDPTYFSWETTLEKFYSVPSFIPLIVQYLLSIVVLEFVIRIVYNLRNALFLKSSKKEKGD